jgi:O-acetyl-ADP-ribose deacetylase (regulator of RNase III)
MIELTRGDILRAEAEALVNTVNCVGVMGRGIALQCKRAFPANFAAYAAACKRGEVQPGRMLVVTTRQLTRPRFIVNFPTKRHWKGKSRIEDIDAGLEALIAEVARLGITSIAIPPLGCGLGGLDWAEVRPRIERAFAALPEVRVLIYEPSGAPVAAQMTRASDPPTMTPGRAVLVGLMERYLAGLLDPFVSLLEVHKLMYFMQEAGEPLRLRYKKALFGPYAENLRQVLALIEGYFVSGYADGGDAPEKQLEIVPGAAAEASSFLAAHPETRARFERVAALVEGFETPFGMELLATVHWVATREGAADPAAAVEAVHRWNERKRAFSARQIHLAWDVLASKGWMLSGAVIASA